MNSWFVPYFVLIRNIISFQKQKEISLSSVLPEHRPKLVPFIIRVLAPKLVLSPMEQGVKRKSRYQVERKWKKTVK